MERSDIQKYKIPDASGVYFFLGKKKEILYIGKATSLKHRVRSYFDLNIKEKRSALIEKMVAETKKIEWTATDSVLEAMLLETNLIRTHKPVYNTRSKDDKSFNHVIITDEEFPRVLIVRGKDLQHTNTPLYTIAYGPFPSGALFREALKIMRRLFQFYDNEAPTSHTRISKMHKGKLDFNRQIGLYPQENNKREYAQTIRHIKLFFEGKKHQIINELERDMMRLAKKEQFEKAQVNKKRIFALKHIQDVALIRDDAREFKDEKSIRIEAYDIAHMGGKDMVGVMVVMLNDEPNTNEYRKFIIRNFTDANDPGALSEVLTRRLTHPEWPYPELIVVDGNTIQKRAAEKVLNAHNVTIPVVGVTKDERHKPIRLIGSKKLIEKFEKSILHANVESHRFAITFHRKRRNESFSAEM